eukprot:TRINITY_DN7437_c0_g1_i1.p2 TRINITY_DN7437_c0_g1~~TRINITY_DN7437_c0_g1_i1.p2  ORF type:complete len:131 (-),score=38.30 TRINITY_DN7437_c0_g1_i1:116-508(-)
MTTSASSSILRSILVVRNGGCRFGADALATRSIRRALHGCTSSLSTPTFDPLKSSMLLHKDFVHNHLRCDVIAPMEIGPVLVPSLICADKSQKNDDKKNKKPKPTKKELKEKKEKKKQEKSSKYSQEEDD